MNDHDEVNQQMLETLVMALGWLGAGIVLIILAWLFRVYWN